MPNQPPTNGTYSPRACEFVCPDAPDKGEHEMKKGRGFPYHSYKTNLQPLTMITNQVYVCLHRNVTLMIRRIQISSIPSADLSFSVQVPAGITDKILIGEKAMSRSRKWQTGLKSQCLASGIDFRAVCGVFEHGSFTRFGSLGAIMERRCGDGRLVREIQYKNTSYSSRSRICMHALHRKAQVLLYLIVLFVFHFFLRAIFFLFFPRSRSFFLPKREGRMGGTWGVRD